MATFSTDEHKVASNDAPLAVFTNNERTDLEKTLLKHFEKQNLELKLTKLNEPIASDSFTILKELIRAYHTRDDIIESSKVDISNINNWDVCKTLEYLFKDKQSMLVDNCWVYTKAVNADLSKYSNNNHNKNDGIFRSEATLSVVASAVPHNHDLWKYLHFEIKNGKKRNYLCCINLWKLVQLQTVFYITNKNFFNLYELSDSTLLSLLESKQYSKKNMPQIISQRKKNSKFYNNILGTHKSKNKNKNLNKNKHDKEKENEKENKDGIKKECIIYMINMDCIETGVQLKKLGFNPAILNCANQEYPAYALSANSEGGTQEENLFKRTTLYLTLWARKQKNIIHKPCANYQLILNNISNNRKAKKNIDKNSDNKEIEIEEQKKDNINSKGKKNSKRKSNVRDSKNEIKESLDNIDEWESYYPMEDEYGAIYSKNVWYFRGRQNETGYKILPLNQQCILSFITLAAKMNCKSANTHKNKNKNKNKHNDDELTLSKQDIKLWKQKIDTIFAVAIENGHKSIVLSAIGCGAFNNPPNIVANLFNQVIEEYSYRQLFDRIVFAILSDHNSPSDIFQAFQNCFETKTAVM